VEKEMLDKIIAQYNKQTTSYYAAARLWVDAIIDPIETRMVISEGIKAANHAPIEKEMNVGVFQV
jgi:acetyl-CoA carboxylase carboxyltransferase component